MCTESFFHFITVPWLTLETSSCMSFIGGSFKWPAMTPLAHRACNSFIGHAGPSGTKKPINAKVGCFKSAGKMIL